MTNEEQYKNMVLELRDKEECDYIIFSLKKLPLWTSNVNKSKLNNLIASLSIIKESLTKRF